MRYTGIALATALVAFGAGGAQAQNCSTSQASSLASPISCSVTATMTATVPAILYLETNGTNYTFNQATLADYNAGHMSSATQPTLLSKGNVPYIITAKAASIDFSPFHTGDTRTKPVGDILLTGGTGYSDVPVTATGATIESHTQGSFSGLAVPAKLALSWLNDPAGTYSTTITFTIISN